MTKSERLSLGRLRCTISVDGTARRLQFKTSPARAIAIMTWVGLALQGLALVLIIVGICKAGWTEWQAHAFETNFWIVVLCGVTIIATGHALTYYLPERGGQIAAFHPALRRRLSLRSEGEATYRDPVAASPKVTVDGRQFDGGELVCFAISRGERSNRRLHVVFRRDAIILAERLVRESEVREFAARLALATDSHVKSDLYFNCDPEKGVGSLLPLSILSASGGFLLCLARIKAGPFLAFSGWCLGILFVTWGVHRSLRWRRWAHESFMREVGTAPVIGSPPTALPANAEQG